MWPQLVVNKHSAIEMRDIVEDSYFQRDLRLIISVQRVVLFVSAHFWRCNRCVWERTLPPR